MSIARVRRIVAIAGAVPLLVAGSPVTPALASGEYLVENVINNGQVVGPNAGFLGRGIGQTGTTPLFRVTLPSDTATIANVKLTIPNDDGTANRFSVNRDLDAGKGLALYEDVDDDGIFDAGDKATGLRSENFQTDRIDVNGNVPVRLSIPAPVSGSETFWITITPAAGALTGQKLRFEVPAAGVDGSGGSGGSGVVSTPLADNRMVLDSKAPDAAPRSAFIVDENVAGEQDAYSVAPSAGSQEAGLKVAFFNSSTDKAASNILTRPGFNAAQPIEGQLDQLAFDTVIDSPSAPHRIEIGDGTGIVPGGQAVANNNQLSNNVYARLIDAVGNLSVPTILTDCSTTTTATDCPAEALPDNPHNANNVVAPEQPTAAAIPVGRINIANNTAVVATGTSASTAGANRQGSGALSSATSTKATKSRLLIAAIGEDGQPDFDVATDLSILTWAATASHTRNTETVIPEGRAFAVAWNSDDLGNVSAARISASVPKDITRPTAAFELASGATEGSPGDVIGIQFSEPMDTTKIVATAPIGSGTGSAQRCQTEAPNSTNTVSRILMPQSSTGDPRSWGYNNCFAWGVGGTTATIRLGDSSALGCIPDGDPPLGCTPLAGVGTRVFYNATGTPTDANGNPVLGLSPSSGNNGYAPIVAPPSRPDLEFPAETRDLNSNGVLDGVVVTFTSNVDLTTFSAAQPNLTVVANGVSEPITTAEYVLGNHKKILFGFGSTFGTGVIPEVRLAASGPGAPTGFVGEDSRPMPPFQIPTVDRAAPQLKSAHTVDSDKNGRIDQVVVTFSEAIQHGLDHNNVQVNGTDVDSQPGGYRVLGYEQIPAGTPTRNRVTPTTGTTDSKVISLKEVATTAFDTGATPVVQFFGGAPFPPVVSTDDRAWYDAEGNKGPAGFSTSTTVPSASITATDATAPVLVQRKTADLDVDGVLDAIDLKWSEAIPTRTTNSSFEVAGHAIVDQFGLGVDGIRAVIDETALRGRGDTGVKPLVKYLGGMDDGLGNATAPEAAGVASTDGAAPVIVGACVSSPKGNNGLCPEDDPANDATGNPDKGAKMNVFFSEVLNTTTVQQADFKVEQPQGVDKGTATGAPTFATNGTGETQFSIVTLPFAANTFDYLADAYVRLAAADAVSDPATPVANLSKQISNVTAFGFPTVDLTVTCPVAVNPGFCSQLTVNVDTNSSPGVTMWRLSETAPATSPPDSEFTTAAIPTTYTFPAEGTYTLYLNGKDAYGRLSATDSAPIRILKPPTLKNFQFVNSTPGVRGGWSKSSTITDGDNLLIGADAYGTDAAEWASAATGGGCFAQNMSIDLRAITGKSNLGTVAPLKCDLNTSGEQPYRAMQFPVTKAAGTTRYPVGTVLKTSDTDPGSMIVDGPQGTYRRKAFISVNARRSWMITDASVIKVPSALMSAITKITPSIGYRDGALLRSPTGHYLVYRSQKRAVSAAQLAAWRIPTSTAYVPTTTELNAMSTGSRLTGSAHPAGTWIKFANGAIYQVVRNAQGVNIRRKLAHTGALRTLVPTTHIRPAVSGDSSLPVDSWLIGYRDGTMLRHADGSFSVVSRRSLRRFANSATFNSLGFNAANALGANAGAMPRVSGQNYRTGKKIDRYLINTVVIKVTNKAGSIVTLTVVPSIPGIYGLGELDPAPSGWDFTR